MLHGLNQPVGIERLREILIRPALAPTLAGRIGIEGGQYDHVCRILLRALLDSLTDLEPTHVRQHEVKDHRLGGSPFDLAQRIGARERGAMTDARHGNVSPDQLIQIGVVLHHQNVVRGQDHVSSVAVDKL